MSEKISPVFLSRVEFCYGIKGRGVIVDPGIPDGPIIHHVLIGDDLEIRRPDGSILSTKVRSFQMSGNLKRRICAIILPPEITEEDVPVGSEVWQVSCSRPRS